MIKSELAVKIREFLLDSPDVDDNVAPGLKLLRQAAVALEQPTLIAHDESTATSSAELVRTLDVMLNGDNAAAQASLTDIITQIQAEPEGKLLGYVNSEYVAQLLHGNFDGLDIEITKDAQSSGQLAIYDRPRLTPVEADTTREMEEMHSALTYTLEAAGLDWDRLQELSAVVEQLRENSDEHLSKLNHASPKTAVESTSFAEQFVAQVRTMLGFEGTDEELAEACQAYGKQYADMEQAVLDRDEQIAAQDKLIGAVIDAAKSDWQYVDDLPTRVAQLRAAYDKSKLSQAVEEVAAPLAGWVSDAIDLAHAVRGDLRPENRIMAKAAENIIMAAPRGAGDGE